MPFITLIEPIQPMEKMELSANEVKVETSSSSFSDILSSAVQELEAAQAQSNADSMKLALGDVDDIAQVQINAMKTSTMVQTAVQLTTRAVNAYKEIMQMQI